MWMPADGQPLRLLAKEEQESLIQSVVTVLAEQSPITACRAFAPVMESLSVLAEGPAMCPSWDP